MKAKNKFAVLLMAGITALSSVPAYAAEVYGAARGKPIILQSDIYRYDCIGGKAWYT